MKMYEGLEPCAGCQKSGRDAPRWSKGELCQTCQKDLNLGRELKKDFDPAQYVYVRSTWYKLEFYPNAHGKRIEKGFYRLMDFLERKVDYAGSITLAEGSGITSPKQVIMAREAAEAIKQIVDALFEQQSDYRQAVKAVEEEKVRARKDEYNKIYNEGVKKGRDLLFGLQEGTVSLQDFEKEYIKY